MNSVEAFFCTAVEREGSFFNYFSCGRYLEEIGNFFLSPVHILWKGWTVRIVTAGFNTNEIKEVHDVASFHQAGHANLCPTYEKLHSSELNWVRTTLAIIWLVPGLILGTVIKMAAFVTEETNVNFREVLTHFTPCDITVGEDSPITRGDQTSAFEAAEREYHPFQKVEHLIMVGDGDVVLSGHGEVLDKYRPNKVILVGTSLFREEAPSFWKYPLCAIRNILEHGSTAFSEAMREVHAGNFLHHSFLEHLEKNGFEMERTLPKVYTVSSVEEAKKHRPPGRALYRVVPKPIDLDVGAKGALVSEATEDDAFEKVEKTYRAHRGPLGTLTIWGDGNLVVSARGDFFRKARPEKIILCRASLEPDQRQRGQVLDRARDGVREIQTGRLYEALLELGDYEMEGERIKVYEVNSIEEAKAHTPPMREEGIPYHAVYQVRESGR